MKTFKQYITDGRVIKEEAEKRIVSASGVDGSGQTTVKYEDGTEEVRTGPRPERNNNPGNLEASPWTQGQAGYVGSDGRYAVFATKQDGWNAKINLLKTGTYQNLSIKDAFNKYAPPNENPNYIRDLQSYTGFDLNRQMNSLNDQEFNTLVNAVAKIEGAESYVGKYIATGTTTTAKTDTEDVGGQALANLQKNALDVIKGGFSAASARDALKNVLAGARGAIQSALPAGTKLPF